MKFLIRYCRCLTAQFSFAFMLFWYLVTWMEQNLCFVMKSCFSGVSQFYGFFYLYFYFSIPSTQKVCDSRFALIFVLIFFKGFINRYHIIYSSGILLWCIFLRCRRNSSTLLNSILTVLIQHSSLYKILHHSKANSVVTGEPNIQVETLSLRRKKSYFEHSPLSIL